MLVMSSPYLEPVLGWYADHARDLPWRAPGVSPWAVLVSEIMLQQTPVSRVLPAYQAWLERWPTPAALAAVGPARLSPARPAPARDRHDRDQAA